MLSFEEEELQEVMPRARETRHEQMYLDRGLKHQGKGLGPVPEESLPGMPLSFDVFAIDRSESQGI